MSSSTPLTPPLQDAVAGHGAKSGVGSLQKKTPGNATEQHLIESGYMPVRQLAGKVVGIWGDAHIRHLDGHVTVLHVGDVIHKGEVILTAQDGIVQLEARPGAAPAVGDDVDRTIAQLNQGDIDVVTAAGPFSGLGSSLGEGLRVGRDAESVTPLALDLPTPVVPVQPLVILPVTPLTSPPLANPDAETTAVNTPVVFDARSNDTSPTPLTVIDIAGQPISAGHPVTLPQGSVALNPDGTLTFTPNQNFTGSLTFAYTDQNTTGATSSSTVTVNVVAPPIAAKPDANTVPENGSVGGSLAGDVTQVPGDPNTFTVGTPPGHGTLTLEPGGTYTYTPTTGYTGTDTFTYTVTDATGQTSTATVTLTVTPVAIVAQPDHNTVPENGSVGGSLAGDVTQVPGDPNTFTVGTPPAHGTLTLNPDGTYTYAPATGYTGTDTFTYTATDVSGQTSTATVTLTVTPLPIAAKDDANQGPENTPITGSVSADATVVPGDPNTFTVGTQPSHGTVTVNTDGSYTYTPATGYTGTDSFTYVVTDHSGATSTATVHLNVTPLAIAAKDDSNTGPENSPIAGSVAADATQIAGDPNTFTLGTGTAHGTVVVNPDGTYTYTPSTGYTGTDSFTYVVTDHSGATSTATVSLTVVPLPIAAKDDAGTGPENTPITGSVAADATVIPGDPNTFAAGTPPSHGTVTVNADGSYTYTPTNGYTGTDSFTYVVTDHSGATSTATVHLTVTPLPIVARDDSGTGPENNPISGSVANDVTQVAGDPNTFALGGVHPANGTVVVNADGSYTYKPNTGYTGIDSFTYVVTDQSGATSTATVHLTVTPLAIVAKDDANTVTENGSVAGSVAADASVIPGDPNTFKLGTGTAHGSVNVNADGTYVYTPTLGYSGPDSFTYVVTDRSGATSTATVALTVVPIDPIAKPDVYTTNEDTPLTGQTVIANDTPVVGETNAWSVVSQPTHGTLVLAADFATSGKFTYTPSANWSGTDTFTYTITDGSGHASTTTATINVIAVADAPTLSIIDKTYLASTDLEEVSVRPGYDFSNVPVSSLGSGSGTTTATHSGIWQTDNGATPPGVANTVEVGLGTLYGMKNADGTPDTSHVIELEQNATDVGNLYTTMATKAGEVYNLSFDYAARDNFLNTSVIYVYWEGQLVETLNTQSATMTHFDLQLVASVTGTGKLEFIAGDSNSFGGALDNLSMALAPSTSVQGYAVNLPSIASSLVDTDGSESLKTVIDAIPVGSTLTDGTHTFTATVGATAVDVSNWSLGSLSLDAIASFTGDITLGVHATSTEASNGSTATTDGSVTLHVLSNAAGIYGTAGGDAMTITDASTTSTAIRWGLDGNDSITGSIGHDTLVGGAGNDTLVAGSGPAVLDGGTGNDSLVGGAGADTLSGGASALVNGVMGHNTLTGGAGSDTFKWSLIDPELVHPGDATPLKAGDPGTEGHAFQDVITDFNNAAPANGGDVLDLRDLLVGELKGGTTVAGNLTNYLHFETVGTGDTASTVIHISSHGDFASGYSAGAEDTTITLLNINLQTTPSTTDAQIISTLINNGKLVVDGH